MTATLTVVEMPRLSDSMEEGTIVTWLKRTGETVEAGEEFVEIETDKATMAFEAEVGGILTTLVEEGETVALGAPIAKIGAAVDDSTPPADPVAERAVEPAVSDGDVVAAATRPTGPGPESQRPAASPLARRIASELGVDLAALHGTGHNGRIVKADVEAAAGNGSTEVAVQVQEAAPSPPAPVATAEAAETAKGATTVQELSRLQQVVARRMAEAKATAPDFALRLDVDMEAAVALREELRGTLGEGEPLPSFNDFVVKASALALREHPLANGSYRDGRFELHERVNVGVAVAADDALVVPVVADADRKGLGAIAAESRRLAEKVRDGTVTPPELAGGTFTVSNLGMFGIESFTAVINVPQAAILAVGAMAPRAVVAADGSLVARRTMSLTLSCDHRILYGAQAAQFLGRIGAILEQPLRLAL